MQLNKLRRTTRPAQGFTLLEVLIALVVLSVGLLGLSGLQTTSLRNNHSAFLRSQATIVAHDVIDRMRANKGAAENGDYSIAYGVDPSSTSCSSNCSTQAIAQMDVAEWRAYVGRLPGGEGAIAYNATSDIATVSVRWNDARDVGGKLEFVTEAQL
jgi:type IV pilus assembly protein PilV